MRKSYSSPYTSANSVIVRNNAPNWPAMVERTSRPESRSNNTLTSSASSIWMKSRQLKNEVESQYTRAVQPSQRASPKKEKFASKTLLVRQCTKCQTLYTNFHKCIEDEEEKFKVVEKEDYD
jgi:hypothetical protein